MPDLWLPGIQRIDTSDQAVPIALQGVGKYLHTWHTFETGDKGYNYSPTGIEAARYLISQRSTSTFVFHPTTGALVQMLPANVGTRTLQANGPSQHTNAYGSIHMQTEVIANAARPFTLDLTREGIEGLTTLMNFLRSWGIPDQWAWAYGPPAYPGGSVQRSAPVQSGHSFHSGWWVNSHGDPGAIQAPWLAINNEEAPVVEDPRTYIDVANKEANLRGRGYNIYDGPSFVKAGKCYPGAPGHGHLADSTHFYPRGQGGAVDVGRDPSSGAAISTFEKAHLDDLARELMREQYRVIWGVANHYDHLHFDYNLYGTGGGHQVVFQGPNGEFTVAHILWVQTSLKKLGYYTGTLDGLREAGTLAAIKAFQKAKGLTQDGEPGNNTSTAIRTALAALTTPTPTPTPVPAPTPAPTLAERIKPYRVAGSNRWTTAVAVDKFVAPSGVGVILAAQDSLDLEMATTLRSANVHVLPVLFGGGLPSPIRARIVELKPTWIRAIGGSTTVLDTTVYEAMTAAGIKV